MCTLTTLPGEVLDLVFDNLDPRHLKSLRLTNRTTCEHIGNSYIQHIVITSDRERLKHIEKYLDSIPIARCIKRLTFDCRKLLPAHQLVRVIYKEDPMSLILRNYDKIGDHYTALASRFLDGEGSNDDIGDLLTALVTIIRKLPSLRHVTVAEQTHYGNVLPMPRYLVNDLKGIHPLLTAYVDDNLTKRMVWSGTSRTRVMTRTVILAVWKAASAKCDIELQTLYARCGNGGGPTTRGLCDVVQWVDVTDPVVLTKRILRDRPKDTKIWGSQFVEVLDGSPVISKGVGISPIVHADWPKTF